MRKSWVAVMAAIGVAGAYAPAAHAQSSAQPLKVVQLGDSYSAGNGAGSYYGPKDCYRSSANWAEKYIAPLRSTRSITFVNRACSGGVINDLTSRRKMEEFTVPVIVADAVEKDDPQARAVLDASGRCAPRYRDDESYEIEPDYALPQFGGGTVVYFKCTRYMEPQIDAVGGDTDLVLFTIGGNDIHFADIITQCFVIGIRDPGDCRDKIDDGKAGIGDVGVRTAAFLRALKARMRPDAQVVLLAYPYLEKNPDLTLRGGFLFLDNYAVGREIRSLGDLGDQGQQAAVDAVNAEGGAHVTFLDSVKPHFAGHEPDGRVTHRNPDRWLHEFDTTTKMEWYHYNSTGHSEIAYLLGQRPDILPDSRDVIAGGAVDIAFVIDTTGSMGSSIDSVKAAAVRLVNDVAARTSDARFALIDYRDFPERTGSPGDYPSKLDLDFTSDATAINAAIQGLALGDGGDWEETMFSGLNQAYSLAWRPGVKKLTIVLTDAPALSPEPISGLTAADIVAKSLSIDPVEAQFIDVGDATTPELEDIATRTNGGIHRSADSAAADEIAGTIDASLDRPYAWAGGPYVMQAGGTAKLDGSGSYGVKSDIVKWAWDFDNDGTYDAERDQPTLDHVYADAYDGLVALRVTDAAGKTGLATSVVHVTRDGDEIADDVDNCPDVSNPDQGDEDGDGAGNECDATPGFATTDKPGVTEFLANQQTSTPPPATTPPSSGTVARPRADVRVDRPRIVGHGRAVKVKVTCIRATGGCRGKVRVQVGKRKVAHRYLIAAGKAKTLVFGMPKPVRARLAKHRKVVLRVGATTREGVTATRKVTVRLARRK